MISTAINEVFRQEPIDDQFIGVKLVLNKHYLEYGETKYTLHRMRREVAEKNNTIPWRKSCQHSDEVGNSGQLGPDRDPMPGKADRNTYSCNGKDRKYI